MNESKRARLTRLHARRNFRPRTSSSGRRYGLESYFSFSHSAGPAWWPLPHLSFAGGVLGVLELTSGSPESALVVTTDEIAALAPDGAVHVRYTEVETFERLTKEPMSEAINIELRSGERVALPVPGATGVIFTVLVFFIYAVREARKERGEYVPE